ncbi:hypothetical protein EVAR_19734_1 [Eumeta japonica]|uniref:Uncharacterized protein n=1 Tax=Eumeta variegata TaxID=151549 RepID=A0A4C1UQF0_EUMVA|nr:hypothetical protein EVAR_19734_1 [Eumeta japonica]
MVDPHPAHRMIMTTMTPLRSATVSGRNLGVISAEIDCESSSERRNKERENPRCPIRLIQMLTAVRTAPRPSAGGPPSCRIAGADPAAAGDIISITPRRPAGTPAGRVRKRSTIGSDPQQNSDIKRNVVCTYTSRGAPRPSRTHSGRNQRSGLELRQGRGALRRRAVVARRRVVCRHDAYVSSDNGLSTNWPVCAGSK